MLSLPALPSSGSILSDYYLGQQANSSRKWKLLGISAESTPNDLVVGEVLLFLRRKFLMRIFILTRSTCRPQKAVVTQVFLPDSSQWRFEGKFTAGPLENFS
jgi:hypothetical protein